MTAIGNEERGQDQHENCDGAEIGAHCRTHFLREAELSGIGCHKNRGTRTPLHDVAGRPSLGGFLSSGRQSGARVGSWWRELAMPTPRWSVGARRRSWAGWTCGWPNSPARCTRCWSPRSPNCAATRSCYSYCATASTATWPRCSPPSATPFRSRRSSCRQRHVEHARRLAQRGVTVNALVRAYRLGHKALLDAVLDEIRTSTWSHR